jgi:hypothetical protein
MKKQPTTINRSIDQKDTGLGFDGLVRSSQGNRQQEIRNQYAGVQDPNKTVNVGRGATTGNTGRTANAGAKQPMAAAVKDTSSARKSFAAGTFNAGAQVRNPSGTRKWEPKCENNYVGNIDSRNVGRGPTKGNSQ